MYMDYCRFSVLSLLLVLATGCFHDENNQPADTASPQIGLAGSADFFYARGTLTLTATGTENVAVDKVVFMRGDEKIGSDSDAPYALDVELTDDLNGTQVFTARVVDTSGNKVTTDPINVLVDIGSKFFGTAPDVAADYKDLLKYFNQLTPSNAGKWESVEAERDVMVWGGLDTAYKFARSNDLPFKFHTLVWGQQQPGWMNDDTLTDKEKRAEIDEWMAAVARRYPDLEMIDVVNEPLHEPPAYAEALGGKGETGWDWVITAFEMARKHFPKSILILNDYQILHLERFTRDYLEIIELLRERDLIDAIGVQAHFLEQAQAEIVQTNLDTLAETRLPIYVSEFDLDIADDALHANRIRDLFTVFWGHPQVVGITHWGHLKDHMWRTNGHLLLSDRSTRAGMNWMLCHMSGKQDCDAMVPKYVPPGWQGDEYGVTLEAESYDEGDGLITLGDVVAYTNAGDWIKFSNVKFQDGWDTLWVNYIKGNDDGYEATISIHFGSLESAPVKTIVLAPTGGWAASNAIEIAWSPISKVSDVYIRFHVDPRAEAVANLDNIRIGQSIPVGDNMVNDSSFEGASLPSGWGTWWKGGTSLDITTDKAFTGKKSLRASNRVADSHPSYNLTALVDAATTYAVSAQAQHAGADNDTLTLTYKLACDGKTDVYGQIQKVDKVAPKTWTRLSGTLPVPTDCDINEARIYFEGTTFGVDVYIDDVSVTLPVDNPGPVNTN